MKVFVSIYVVRLLYCGPFIRVCNPVMHMVVCVKRAVFGQ
jgi:hypothetical protein